MFDKVRIGVEAGAGGAGIISFRREKFAPYGGPDGGDGGNGGDVIILADPYVDSLYRFRNKRFHRAVRGKDGMAAKKHGKSGENLVLTVPVGTLVSSESESGGDEILNDLEQPGQQVTVARGGKGGWGNIHFTSSTNQAPQIAQRGEPGEERWLTLEIRLIADVGIIGYPNVGKSTLLTAASAAKPKIASYPFTTIEPALGVVEVGQQAFALAEIPGLVVDAHLGRGLGHDFLRHAMRTRILIHLVDGTSLSPVTDMANVDEELNLFDSSLGRKTQIIAVNKIDLPEAHARMDEMESAFGSAGHRVVFISAETGEGVPELMAEAMKMLDRVSGEAVKSEVPRTVFRPRPSDRGISIQKEGDTFIVAAPELERIITRGKTTDPEIRWQLNRMLVRMGVNKALKRAGAKPGDEVRCGDFEWEY